MAHLFILSLQVQHHCPFSNRMLGKHMLLDSGGGDGEIQAPSTGYEPDRKMTG
jgi:hypothetical protein